MYEDKNKRYRTDGNEELDKLLSMIDNNGVLSENFNRKIDNIVIWILTNHKEHIDDIKNEIKKFEDEMNWLNMFNSKFITKVIMLLYNGLEKQIVLSNTKKYNL